MVHTTNAYLMSMLRRFVKIMHADWTEGVLLPMGRGLQPLGMLGSWPWPSEHLGGKRRRLT